MITAKQLCEWLADIPDDECIAIDDGGLILESDFAYIEAGGWPDDPVCEDCGINPADPPSRICPGCEAYREHTAGWR